MSELLAFVNNHDNWKELLSQPPYNLTINNDGYYYLFKYNMLESDLSNPIVQEARGLIIERCLYDEQYVIVCQPFKKFFNWNEPNAADIDWNTAYITEKIDGTLINVWFADGKWRCSTTGTPDAFKAMVNGYDFSFGELFEEALNYPLQYFCQKNGMNIFKTYCFELVSQANQIVIPHYKTRAYFLTSFDTTLGTEYRNFVDNPVINTVRYPQRYSFKDIAATLEYIKSREDIEGVVVADSNGNRIKMKTDAYILLHKAVTRGPITKKRMLEFMYAGIVDDLLSNKLFSDYIGMYREVMDDLGKLKTVCDDVYKTYMLVYDGPADARKNFAIDYKDSPYKDYVFKRIDGKVHNFKEYIQKQYIDRGLVYKVAELMDY